MTDIKSLTHTTRALSGGGEVIILNTGAAITPEAEAMLQALHSRSIGGIKSHLEVLAEKGSEKFMSTFYVGYGHKSIGDCGTATIFIEGVSMLAAKAIQDWPLYSGQEASTRYIDFAEQTFLNPLGTKEGDAVLENWRSFYLDSMEEVKGHVREQFPRQDDEDEKKYEKAVAARAFDILRGFLPAGATTNLAWHTNLRQAADKLMTLRHHPLEEVREIAETIEEALNEAYPSSFGHKRYEATENYNKALSEHVYYHNPDASAFSVEGTLDTDTLEQYKAVLKDRPEKTELPKFLNEAGTVTFEFLLDFGSFRDIQRHRAVTQRMPLLTTELGFHLWYMESLPENVRENAQELLKTQEKALGELGTTPEVAQYYTAMGYNTSNKIIGTLPNLVYLVELRATRFVHPTLRMRAQQMAETLQKQYGPHGLTLHLDPDAGRFDIKRGDHDITQK